MSMYLRKRTLSGMNEEDAEEQNNSQQQDSSANVEVSEDSLRKQLAQVNAKLVDLEREFNNRKQPILNQKSAILAQGAKLGFNLENQSESANSNFRFSKKLFEAVQTGKTDELADSVKETFDKLPDISYYMDNKGCLTLAKRLLAFLNDKTWNDGENHWDEVSEFLVNTLSKANISLSSREMGQFIGKFEEVLRSRTMFAWIFGKSQVEPIKEIDEPDDYDDIDWSQINNEDDDFVDYFGNLERDNDF